MAVIRLAQDFGGHKAGEIVEVSAADYVKALNARAVTKTYPGPVPTAGARRPAVKKTAAPARKRAAKKTTPPPSE